MAGAYRGNFTQAIDAPEAGLQDLAMGDLKLAGERQRQDLLPFEVMSRVQGVQASNQLHAAQAKKLEQELKNSSELRSLFGNFQVDPEAPRSKTLTDMAVKAAGTDPILTRDLLTRAENAALAEERGERQKAEAVKARAVAALRTQEQFKSLFGLVKTPEEFERHKLGLLALPATDADGYAREYISRMDFGTYRRMGTTLELEAKAAQAAAATLRAQTGARVAEVRERQVEINRDAETRRDAQGAARDKARPIRSPNAQDRENAAAFLKNAPEAKGVGGAAAANLAGDLAARTLRVMNERPQLGADEARKVAFGELTESGALTQTENAFGQKRATYTPLGPRNTPKLPSGAPAAKAKITPGESVAYDKAGNAFVARDGKWVPAQ